MISLGTIFKKYSFQLKKKKNPCISSVLISAIILDTLLQEKVKENKSSTRYYFPLIAH